MFRVIHIPVTPRNPIASRRRSKGLKPLTRRLWMVCFSPPIQAPTLLLTQAIAAWRKKHNGDLESANKLQ